MAVESDMTVIGKKLPNFTLPDVVSGKTVSFESEKSDVANVVMFICNHCPYVKHVREQLVELANDYLPKGVKFFAINSNDVEAYPDDSPENMKKLAEQFHFPFPYLFDESQQVAKAYKAQCTPDFYVLDSNLTCIYHGQLDDARPSNEVPVTGTSLRLALDTILQGEKITFAQKPSMGCSIKWKEQ
ncbi:thioredoxin family protein [Fervidibacillus albus]|uniref:Thioredoxin family protein n=1 Tax=Fervidibacillus albus TaxID=2980026 RepID=A0A9E8RV33_9BACI|nr:thioredoxin family protein [Fervidibacillus albus]WAA08894.1 thioredoxin family protein [Fervidibacillus albus]